MDLNELSWLTGSWRLEHQGEVREEHWSEALGGVMMGMTRWVREGKVVRLELSSIQVEDDVPVLRTRTFDQSLADQDQEVMSWPLVSHLGRGEATFENRSLSFPRKVVFHAAAPGMLAHRLEGVRNGEDLVQEHLYRATD